MKPEDILNAIGEVDDKMVKKAHRKDLLKASAVFMIVFLVLAVPIGSIMLQDYILTRLNPDFTVNTGYIDPVDMDAQWTSMEYVGPNGTGKFRRALFGDYRVTHTDNDGNRSALYGGSRGDYLNGLQDKDLYINGYYGKDIAKRTDSMSIRGGPASAWNGEVLNEIELDRRTNGMIHRQYQYRYESGEKVLLGYRVLSYTDSKVSATRDYDAAGNLLAHSETKHSGSGFETVHYDADGTVTGYERGTYNLLGHIKTRETYDAGNTWVSTETYRYSFLERFLSLGGLIALVFILWMSLLAAFTVYDDRWKWRPKSKDNWHRKLQDAHQAIEELRPMLEGIDRESKAGAIKSLERKVQELKGEEKTD